VQHWSWVFVAFLSRHVLLCQERRGSRVKSEERVQIPRELELLERKEKGDCLIRAKPHSLGGKRRSRKGERAT
jgi:hypothetical protein